MLILLLALVSGATGDCKPGVDCVSQSFRPGACFPSANLGTCTAAMKGKARCASDDGNAWYFCNGTSWVKFSSSSDGGGDFVLKSGDTSTGVQYDTLSFQAPQIDAGVVRAANHLYGSQTGATLEV